MQISVESSRCVQTLDGSQEHDEYPTHDADPRKRTPFNTKYVLFFFKINCLKIKE